MDLRKKDFNLLLSYSFYLNEHFLTYGAWRVALDIIIED